MRFPVASLRQVSDRRAGGLIAAASPRPASRLPRGCTPTGPPFFSTRRPGWRIPSRDVLQSSPSSPGAMLAGTTAPCHHPAGMIIQVFPARFDLDTKTTRRDAPATATSPSVASVHQGILARVRALRSRRSICKPVRCRAPKPHRGLLVGASGRPHSSSRAWVLAGPALLTLSPWSPSGGSWVGPGLGCSRRHRRGGRRRARSLRAA